MNISGKNSLEQNCFDGNNIILFESESMAQNYKNTFVPELDNIKVVGVSQDHLKEILGLNEKKHVAIKLADPIVYNLKDHSFEFECVDSNILKMYIR